VSLQIDKGDRLCLVGRNGSGKSTLLQVIAGDLALESGERATPQGIRIARLIQQVPRDMHGSVFAVVAEGLGKAGKTLSQYHTLHDTGDLDDPEILDRLAKWQHILDDTHGWSFQPIIDETLSLMALDGAVEFDVLSSGMKRRVLLARCLVTQPDILILDEPTNHLDLKAIVWLENFLADYRGTLLLVSHDRTFVRKAARGILDIDRMNVSRYDCDFDTYLRRKQQDIASELRQNELFDKRLAQEEVWIRRGVQARRTRNEGRVRRLQAMRGQRSERREQIGNVRLQTQETRTTGRKVIELKHVTFGYGDSDPVIQDLSLTLMRGDRVGIIGPNGVGKTTLIKLLLGQLEPQEGTIQHGTHLQPAYFDQLHAILDLDKTVQENVSPGSDTVMINEQSRNVIGYLTDFLFDPIQIRARVENLSGGERNRLLLARMLAQPANVLVLDEPTNDLDVETLELLEEMLLDFTGTVLLVSHDRSFLNNVVTSTLAFDADGRVREYAGGYDDYLVQNTHLFPKTPPLTKSQTQAKAVRENKVKPDVTQQSKKLTWKEGKELEGLPARIEAMEEEVSALHTQLADPSFYRTTSEKEVARITQRTSELDTELKTAYARWEDLESRNG
ncbi:MAG: ATP-binding cassette domain-containing protein, partial [Planctomycetes bacterium]|nr:ATP-binding cassette domain-containing protein [Planctomycetota bacterium]